MGIPGLSPPLALSVEVELRWAKLNMRIPVGRKDEVRKLINTEKEKIRLQEQANHEFHERQAERFLPVRVALEEVVVPLDPIYVEADFGEDQVLITVGEAGRREEGEFDIFWEISPNSDLSAPDKWEREESLFVDAPGFRIDETLWAVDSDESPNKSLSFESAEGAVEYVVKKLARKLAEYEQLAEALANANARSDD